ncbi:MAG: type II toxin-antitoxin system RelE/ParE family toxin [Chloroflexia bacterium]|nr:type II toxin-antitoxin system RelE/ParE family toxin [Chloroflexia bacterium]
MRSSTDLIVSPQAEDDVGDIYGYTRKTWGAAQADAYVQVVDAALRRIQAFPTSAR